MRPLSFFYEIRSPDDTVLKWTGGFPDCEAATEAARADAKRLKAVPKPPNSALHPYRQEHSSPCNNCWATPSAFLHKQLDVTLYSSRRADGRPLSYSCLIADFRRVRTGG